MVIHDKISAHVIILLLKKQEHLFTVNQQILAAIKFGDSQNKVIWRRQILVKIRNSPNSPNITARQNLLIYSID